MSPLSPQLLLTSKLMNWWDWMYLKIKEFIEGHIHFFLLRLYGLLVFKESWSDPMTDKKGHSLVLRYCRHPFHPQKQGLSKSVWQNFCQSSPMQGVLHCVIATRLQLERHQQTRTSQGNLCLHKYTYVWTIRIQPWSVQCYKAQRAF